MRSRIPLLLLFAVFVSFSAGTIYAGSGKTWSDPDEGRTPEQVEAAQKAASEKFWARYPDWIREHNARGVDLAALEWYGMLADPGLPAPSLNEAAVRADMIIKGSVTGHQFRASDTLVQVDVSSVLKGAKKPEIAVIFPGGLQPYPDWDTAAIGFLESAPIPRRNDHVLLFLQSAPLERGAFSPQAFTGMYVVSGDHLRALEGNPFADQVERLGLAALTKQMPVEAPLD